MAARALRSSSHGQRRIRHRRPDGELHRARGGASCRAAKRRVERRGRRVDRSAVGERDPRRRGAHHDGAELADSWGRDAHKWLNVPYDSGIVIVRDSAAHRASMTVTAEYLEQSAGKERDPFDWAPEFSRRGRAIPIYAALRHLG